MELGQRHLSAVAGIFDNLTRSSGHIVRKLAEIEQHLFELASMIREMNSEN